MFLIPLLQKLKFYAGACHISKKRMEGTLSKALTFTRCLLSMNTVSMWRLLSPQVISCIALLCHMISVHFLYSTLWPKNDAESVPSISFKIKSLQLKAKYSEENNLRTVLAPLC